MTKDYADAPPDVSAQSASWRFTRARPCGRGTAGTSRSAAVRDAAWPSTRIAPVSLGASAPG